MSRAKGDIAEDAVVSYLLHKGYVIEKRNYYSRFGELDIIASFEGILHFVEVKSAVEYEQAVENITPKKLSKLQKTAAIYMNHIAYDESFCFDAAIVTPEGISFIENITL